MGHIVVDASVIIEYLITGPHTPSVQSFFNRISASDRLVVPEFCLLECTNVIWKQVRFGGMTPDHAHALLKVLRAMDLRRAPVKPLLDQALDIALNNALAVYDSSYIALALHYGYPLISLDQPQIRAAVDMGVRMISMTGFRTE